MTPTAEERAAFKEGEWRRIADLHPGVAELVAEAVAAERRATVERIREAFDPYADSPDVWFAILDEEAAR